jgi:transcription-repair coupling factor (superfamily II helicase)
MKAQGDLAKIKDNKIIVRRDWKSDKDKITGAFAIARDLAEAAGAVKKRK